MSYELNDIEHFGLRENNLIVGLVLCCSLLGYGILRRVEGTACLEDGV